MQPVPFFDLKAQYNKIKPGMQARINAVLEHGQFVMGPEVIELEKVLAKFIGTKHVITCASGMDALYLSLLVLGIGPGDEVIVPDFTFFATAECASLLGATPVFVDVDPKTYNIDVKLIEAKVTKKTKAIIPVSLYGQPADLDEINVIAKKHNLIVIEDACQSFGALYKGKRSCAISDIGATSFFPTKPLGCYGDGGALFTDNDDLAKALTEARLHGQSGRYVHSRLGITGRLDTIQAAVLLEKMTVFADEIKKREEIAAFYTEGLSNLVTTPMIKSDRTSVYAQYTILVDQRDEFMNRMKERGIPTAVHYPVPLSMQPYYAPLKATPCTVAKDVASRVVSLPMSADLSRADQKRVIEAVKGSI